MDIFAYTKEEVGSKDHIKRNIDAVKYFPGGPSHILRQGTSIIHNQTNFKGFKYIQYCSEDPFQPWSYTFLW